MCLNASTERSLLHYRVMDTTALLREVFFSPLHRLQDTIAATSECWWQARTSVLKQQIVALHPWETNHFSVPQVEHIFQLISPVACFSVVNMTLSQVLHFMLTQPLIIN